MPLHLMIVDDDEPFRSAVSRAMRARGFVVQEAKDGAEALRLIKGGALDIVVTDLLMPGSDGVQLIASVRRLRPELPVIAMSGRPSMGGLDMLGMATALGAGAALQKPFSIDELADAVALLCPREDAA